MSLPFEDRLDELTPEQRELFELFLKKERLSLTTATGYRAPSNTTEEALTRIWSELLGLDSGVDDNYFELGGDSIGIIRMVSQARLQGIALRTEWVFSNPTIAQLAALSRLQQSASSKWVERPAWQELAERIREADPDFARLLKRSGATPVDVYPLSRSQQGLLYHSLERSAAGCYLVQWRFRIVGRLDLHRFKSAWTSLIERHEALRTVFQWVGLDEPLQVVLNRADDTILEESYGGDWHSKGAEVFEEERQTAFDLNKPPLMRIRFVQVADDEWLCFWTHHHLILDGWSQQILLKEFFLAYRGEPLPPVPPRLFRDQIYAWREADDLSAADFWRAQFVGYRPPPRQLKTKHSGVHTVVKRSVPHANRLREALRRKAVTLSVLYQSLWALALTQILGQEDVVFGVACSGRSSGISNIENAVGLFLNTLPFRFTLDTTSSFGTLLGTIQKAQARLIEHEWCGLLSIQNWIGWDRHSPLIDCLYVYERFPLDFLSLEKEEKLAIRDLDTTTHEHYPLVFVVQDEDETTTLSLKHAGLECDVADRCERLLDFIASAPERFIEMPDLSLRDLIADWIVPEARPLIPALDTVYSDALPD